MHLTTKERILLYLLEHLPQRDAKAVTQNLTRESIARASRINTRHLPQYMRPLVDAGWVVERQAHVEGIRQRRKVYELTDAGRRKARALQESLGHVTVRVIGASGPRETTVSEVTSSLGGKAAFSTVVSEAIERGQVDVEALRTGGLTPRVAMLADAPRIERFTGRREELKAIRDENGRRPIVVVQGVPGIGKSSLAAKVCELERGARNILWHKVRSWDTHLTLLAAMAEFFQALDRPGLGLALKRGDTQRAAGILREDLPGTRSLLVFDDAHEGGRDVLSFLGLLKDAIVDAPDAQILVLTRRSLPFYDARDTTITGIVREVNLGGLHPEEVAALFAAQGAPPEALKASRRLHGHPLLCQLLLSAGPPRLPSELPRDVTRFIEDHVYEGLSAEEAATMKTISLFEVPAPRGAVLTNPRTTVAAFQGLLHRLLIRPVGRDAFEVHDTIRAFFLDSFSPGERQEFASLVFKELKGLADRAHWSGDFATAVACLANALKLAGSAEERSALYEALGDSNGRLGDVNAALVAYKMGAKTVTERETALRLQRKSAEVLFDHGEFASASREAAAALEAMSTTRTVERGWIHLVQCRNAIEREDLDEAELEGKEALRVLTEFGVHRGRARALLELGRVDLLRGRPEVVESESLESALQLARDLADPELLAKIHLTMADLAHMALSDAERAMEHFRAVERIPSALADPVFACRYYWLRGDVKSLLQNDQAGAIEDCSQALVLAYRAHDLGGMGQARYGLGAAYLCSARFAEARDQYEEALATAEVEGFAGQRFDTLWLIAQCRLFLGEVAEFRNALWAMDRLLEEHETRSRPASPGLGQMPPCLAAGLHGFDDLLNGESAKCRRAFTEAIRSAEQDWTARGILSNVNLPCVLVWFGMALRAMGHEAEGEGYFSRGVEIFRRRHAEGAVALFCSGAIRDVERRLRTLYEVGRGGIVPA